MRVLVIGGSGLMGCATARKLLEQGHSVSSLSRGGTATLTGGLPRISLPDGVATLVCDRATEGPKLQEMLAAGRFEFIVDYFAMEPAHVQDIVSSYLRPGSALQHYIFVSTNMVYPGGPGGFDISELRPTVPEGAVDLQVAADAPDDYGGLKLKTEAALQHAWATHGFPVTTIRPPSVIGPACDQRHEFLQRVAMGLPLPEARARPEAKNSKDGFRLAFSEDVSDMCCRILSAASREAVLGEAFNVCCDETLSLSDYLAAIRQSAPEEEAAKWPTPDVVEAVLAANRPALRSYEAQSCLDCTKAKHALGWTPTPFAEAMRVTAEWHRPLLEKSRPLLEKSSL